METLNWRTYLGTALTLLLSAQQSVSNLEKFWDSSRVEVLENVD